MEAETVKKAITGDMNIGEVVSKYPETVEVMLSYGLHCVGCQVNAYESIEQGAVGHGMPDETISEMLEKMNKAVKDKPEPKKGGLVLSKAAVNKIKEFAEKQGRKNAVLRIQVVPGGCSGLSYAMGFDDEKKADDVEVEQDGVRLLVDKESMGFIKGSTIDYVDSFQGAGFKFNNPNAHSSCSCGESFH